MANLDGQGRHDKASNELKLVRRSPEKTDFLEGQAPALRFLTHERHALYGGLLEDPPPLPKEDLMNQVH